MKILADVYLHIPDQNAGSERMLHNIFRKLTSFGHECTIITNRSKTGGNKEYNISGVKVLARPNKVAEIWKNSDVVFSHAFLSIDTLVLARAKQFKKPVIHLAHAKHKLPIPKEQGTVVYNSYHLYDKCEKYNGMVCYPPPITDNVKINPHRRFITIISVSDYKGASIFYSMAQRFPQYQFLAIKGAYGEQVIRPMPNVTIVDNTSDISNYLNDTKLLLVPSLEETFCIGAMESISRGIPVIAHPSDGIKECLGNSGTFVSRYEYDMWFSQVSMLMGNSFSYNKKSTEAHTQFKNLENQSEAQLKRLNNLLLELVPIKKLQMRA